MAAGAVVIGADVSVSRLEAAVYTIPTDAPEADGTLTWDSTTLVLVSASAGGRTGIGWSYAAAAAARVVEDLLRPVVVDRPALDVPGCHAAMRGTVRNAGLPGVAACAIAAVDIALWDLKAKLLDLPLAALLGAVRSSIPVYGSGGFTSYSADRLAAQLGDWVHQDGIPRVKIKIGESRGARVNRDIERMHQAREVIGAGAELYVDANGGYTSKQAIRVMEAVRHLDIGWYEEPVSSDDLAGLREVREAVLPDVAAGEYAYDPGYIRRMCPYVDCVQVDATRCLGVTGFLQAAAVADAFGLEVSAHTAPQLHLAAGLAIPNLRHVEWFHDHVRIESMLVDGVRRPVRGELSADLGAPGVGLVFRHADAEPYRVA